METVTLTFQMWAVLALLALTVSLFISEVVRVDVAALLIMVSLGVLTALPGFEGMLDVGDLFAGFSSNAVISIIAVMIIGAGLDRTGVVSRLAGLILRFGGGTEQRVVVMVSGTVGVISSFLQNVGAAALFLPVVSRISARTGLPLSRLLMPMGFCAILGGTMTMVGSSPLILLNDLMMSANPLLPADRQMTPFALFDVTPIGLVLVATGILYFIVAGRMILPDSRKRDAGSGENVADYFRRVYGLDGKIHEIFVPRGSEISGQQIGEIQRGHPVYIVAAQFGGETHLAPPVDTIVRGPASLAVLASPAALQSFMADCGLTEREAVTSFAEILAPTNAGIAELVIPVESEFIGHSARDAWMRKTYGLSLLAIHRRGETYLIEDADIGGMPLEEGDTLVCMVSWEALLRLERNRNFIVVTSDYPRDEMRPRKVGFALTFFALAIGLVLFSDLRLSLCLMLGAVGMVITRVLSMDEAYEAVSWKTVFLLASLIPLGQVVQTSGTAEWIAYKVLGLFGGLPVWGLQGVVAILATGFTLIMSNVGATVLLVPLAINIAVAADANPAVFALTVAIATSNSFLIPTHQVNALIMGPAGYKVADFMRAGSVMTVLFLVVSLVMLNLVF